jgi:transcriptional regulator with XRE-family HTH domain
MVVGMSSTESWRNVGRKVRYLRKANQLTLKQLARGCDLSANAISLIERGEVAPTVISVCKIASALGVPASSFFQEVCPNEVILTRAGDFFPNRPAERALAGLACSVVSNGLDQESKDLFRQDQDLAVDELDSRQSILCLSGQLTYEVNGAVYDLEPGDNLSFNGNAPHRLRNTGEEVATAVVVLHTATRDHSQEGVR